MVLSVPDGRVLEANPKAREVARLSVDDVAVGVILPDVVPEPGASDLRDRLRLLAAGIDVEVVRSLGTVPEYATTPIQARFTSTTWHGEPAVLTEVRDFTERIALEARTRDLEAMEQRSRQLIERLVRLGDAERRQIAMGIHDDPIQRLAAASLMVERLRRRGGEPADEWLGEIESALRTAMVSLRDLLFELAPPELVESGLAVAITSLADQMFAESQVSVRIDIALDEEPTDPIQTTAFRIVAEALTNVRKHTAARSVVVRGHVDDDDLVVEVIDDGAGMRAGAGIGHVGMRSMRDRSEAVGGSLEVTSGAGGTTVLARLPLALTPTTDPNDVDSDAEGDAITEALGRELLRTTDEGARVTAHPETEWLEVIADARRASALCTTRPPRCADTAVQYLAEAVHDGCAIHALDDDGEVCSPVARWHRDPMQLAHLAAGPLGERSGHTSFCATVLATAAPILLDRSRLPAARAIDSVVLDPHSAVLVPIRHRHMPLGVLTIVRDRDPAPFTSQDVRWITVIADVIAGAMPS